MATWHSSLVLFMLVHCLTLFSHTVICVFFSVFSCLRAFLGRSIEEFCIFFSKYDQDTRFFRFLIRSNTSLSTPAILSTLSFLSLCIQDIQNILLNIHISKAFSFLSQLCFFRTRKPPLDM